MIAHALMERFPKYLCELNEEQGPLATLLVLGGHGTVQNGIRIVATTSNLGVIPWN